MSTHDVEAASLENAKAWSHCRDAILVALSPLAVGEDSGVAGGEGAIYFWARLPQGDLRASQIARPAQKCACWVPFLAWMAANTNHRTWEHFMCVCDKVSAVQIAKMMRQL